MENQNNKPERPRRGRPTGQNRVPLNLEQRRARNALYEKERREETARAMAQLAQEVGCDPNVVQTDLLATVINFIRSRTEQEDVNSLQSCNERLMAQIEDCERRLASGETPEVFRNPPNESNLPTKKVKKKRELTEGSSSGQAGPIRKYKKKRQTEVEAELVVPEVAAEVPQMESSIVENYVLESPQVDTYVLESPLVESYVLESALVQSDVLEPLLVGPYVLDSQLVESNVLEPLLVEPYFLESPLLQPYVLEPPQVETFVLESPLVETQVPESPQAVTHVMQSPAVETHTLEPFPDPLLSSVQQLPTFQPTPPSSAISASPFTPISDFSPEANPFDYLLSGRSGDISSDGSPDTNNMDDWMLGDLINRYLS